MEREQVAKLAHELNNTLTLVFGHIELTSSLLESSPESAAMHLERAEEVVRRASDLSRTLVALARSYDATPMPMPEARIAPTKPSKVLLCEDDQELGQVLTRVLRRVGHKVTRVACAEEAIEVLDHQIDFDVLITDIVLPGLSGWELADAVDVRVPGIAVVFMSGFEGDRRQAMGHENALYVPKPFQRHSLLEAVARVVQERKKRGKR
jgi:CheY-like chemotaxis protein